MAVKLIVSDLDGTLLNSRKTVSDATAQILQKASQMGIYTSIATGRMHTCAAFFGKKIDSKVPVISCNGGMMRTVDTNELIYEKYVDDCVGEEILAFLFANKVYCSWYIGMKNIAPYFSWSMFPDYTTVVPFNFIETGNDYKKYTHKITQFILRDNEKLSLSILESLNEKFGKYVSFQQNTQYTIDITPLATTKATGLQSLAGYLGVKPAEVMVLGDGSNDLEMFEYAGIAVAMGNADNSVKKRATFITADCDNNGVAEAIGKVLEI
ncbi:Cof-type HAD-IIB family hydrolase [Pectinatus frisingensis]|uniref:Cof-type HAD-IIB family hydrolase n=1 Tax=Pectinatus frisingensis TaxID=865 RepID=UPI0018C731D7|nr:Cof-type HAD-IIB family hydrolase [Pectinatus frisingensis]